MSVLKIQFSNAEHETDLKTLISLPFNPLTWPVACKSSIAFCHHKSCILYNRVCLPYSWNILVYYKKL